MKELTHCPKCGQEILPGFFDVAYAKVCRADVLEALPDKLKKHAVDLTDDEMEYIVRRMGESYVEHYYWESLGIIAEDVIKQKYKY